MKQEAKDILNTLFMSAMGIVPQNGLGGSITRLLGVDRAVDCIIEAAMLEYVEMRAEVIKGEVDALEMERKKASKL